MKAKTRLREARTTNFLIVENGARRKHQDLGGEGREKKSGKKLERKRPCGSLCLTEEELLT